MNASTSEGERDAGEPLVRLRGVGRSYVMGEVMVRVLDDVTLDIHRGDTFAIVGPSGSGKSTLLNLIGGLDRPSEGRVWYGDQELTHASSRELTAYRRDRVGFVFQFYNLAPSLTARENVMAAAEIARDPGDVDEALARVGLSDRADHFPSQLSGGEQQRVSIARALVKKPELLLCDEPTGALDFETGKRVLRLLIDLNEQFHTTVVIITHNTALSGVARRVVHLRSGRITEQTVNARPTPPEEVVW